MMQYTISFCPPEEIGKIMSFIDKHWSPGHILATNRALLDWQYYDAETSKYNFVIATDSTNNEILGLLGFIPTSHFDHNLKYAADAWGAVWKVLQGAGSPTLKNGVIMGLGVSLLDYLVTQKNLRSYGGVGMNTNVIKMYRYLGFHVGYLNHHYIINKLKNTFNLVDNFEGFYSSCHSSREKHKSSLIADPSEAVTIDYGKSDMPAKSRDYFVNRYLKHPFYKYFLVSIQDGGSKTCTLVYRIAEANTARAIRIVDFFGDFSALSGASSFFQNLLESHDAEYADFYNHGLPGELLEDAGFLKRNSESRIVIPNYFEPFERGNVDIAFGYKLFRETRSAYSVCKGDGDQDRPNLLA